MKAKFINEKFDTETDPIEDMGIGSWKPYKDIIISLDKFKENGGILTKGHEIWDRANSYVGSKLLGYWLDFDVNQHVDLMYNNKFKSVPIPPGAGVKVKTKILYQ